MTPAEAEALAALPPLRDALAAAGLAADKRFGQHFLLDLNITRKIARLAGVGADDTVLEIGPGPGGLTRALLETGARVVAIERDPRFLPLLAALGEAAPDRLTVIEGDALEVDAVEMLRGVGAPADVPVVANLPYNVGTPLLINWIIGPYRPRRLTLMFQKEVAHRIVAAPGESDYGRLAVICQALCRARIVMDLPARAFTPPPKVASAVVELIPLADQSAAASVAALQTITQAAFGQRRKMLRSSLKSVGGAALCAAVGVDANARAETVPVSGFLALADAWRARQS